MAAIYICTDKLQYFHKYLWALILSLTLHLPCYIIITGFSFSSNINLSASKGCLIKIKPYETKFWCLASKQQNYNYKNFLDYISQFLLENYFNFLFVTAIKCIPDGRCIDIYA